MNSLADLWLRSGKDQKRLYEGATEDIVVVLKAWVERRKTHNSIKLATSWDMLNEMDSLRQIANQPGGIQQVQANAVHQEACSPERMDFAAPRIMEQIAAITAIQINRLDCVRSLGNERSKETLLANFLLASLQHRGLRWPQIPCTKGHQADAGVCAFLGTLDQGFSAKAELEALEDEARVSQWRNERRRRRIISDQEIANDPILGVNNHPIGLIPARLRQVIANDPTKPTVQVLCEATSGILDPRFLEFVMSRNSPSTTITPHTTGETTRGAVGHGSTPENTAIHIADMLGNLNVALHDESNSISKNSTAYTVDTPANTTTATNVSSKVAADVTGDLDNATASSSNTFDDTDDTAGPPVTTNTEICAPDQATCEIEGQDEVRKISKAKKKREGRKRAKARAKEAAANAGDPAGSHVDDDEDTLGLVNS